MDRCDKCGQRHWRKRRAWANFSIRLNERLFSKRFRVTHDPIRRQSAIHPSWHLLHHRLSEAFCPGRCLNMAPSLKLYICVSLIRHRRPYHVLIDTPACLVRNQLSCPALQKTTYYQAQRSNSASIHIAFGSRYNETHFSHCHTGNRLARRRTCPQKQQPPGQIRAMVQSRGSTTRETRTESTLLSKKLR